MHPVFTSLFFCVLVVWTEGIEIMQRQRRKRFQQCFPQPVEKSGNADIWGHFRCLNGWKLWKTQKRAYLLAFSFHRLLKTKLKVWIFGRKPEKRTEILWKMGMIFRKMWKNRATFPQKMVKSLGKRFKICRTLFFLHVEMSVFFQYKSKRLCYTNDSKKHSY